MNEGQDAYLWLIWRGELQSSMGSGKSTYSVYYLCGYRKVKRLILTKKTRRNIIARWSWSLWWILERWMDECWSVLATKWEVTVLPLLHYIIKEGPAAFWHSWMWLQNLAKFNHHKDISHQQESIFWFGANKINNIITEPILCKSRPFLA